MQKMPRTAQTAKRSTGGKAPRKDLLHKASRRHAKVGKIRHARFKPGSKYIPPISNFIFLTTS